MPVTIAAEPEVRTAQQAQPAADPVEIEVSSAYRIRVGVSFDAGALNRVLDVLRKR